MGEWMHTVRFQIVTALGICLLITGLLGGFALHALRTLNAYVHDGYYANTVPIAKLSGIQAGQLNIRLQLRRVQVFRDDAGKTAQSVAAIRAEETRMMTKWSEYYPASVSSEKERVIAQQIATLLPQFNEMTGEALKAVEAGNLDAAGAQMDKQAGFAAQLASALVDDLAITLKQAQESVEASGATYRSIVGVTIALFVAALLIGIGVSVYLLRSISRPLSRAIGVAKKIAKGRLENGIVLDTRGEFGELLHALKEMDDQLGSTVRRIKTTAESVTLASREIAVGNLDLSSRTEEQAASLEETAASMTELTETVKQNADHANQANALATNAASVADVGNAVVDEMVATIGRISGSSTKIADITGVIEGIAFQTNILALNAAVEAARAGEQGRGFAVVASEVRNLAQRSASAAKEIKELIGSSVALVADGSEQAEKVSTKMEEVKEAIKRVADIVAGIATASQEQSRGIEQINQAVTQMDEVTQQNAALVEQSAAAAQALEEQAVSLRDAVATFTFSDSASSYSPPVARAAFA